MMHYLQRCELHLATRLQLRGVGGDGGAPRLLACKWP